MNRHCAEAGTPVRSAHSDWGTILAIVVVCVLISVPAIAQKASMYDVEHVMSALESGEHSNLSEEQAIMFASELRFPDAGWLRLQFSDVHLNDGDFIRITSLSDGIEQIITDADPQLDDSAFDGRLISFIFDGGLVDIELSLAPGSAQAGFTVEELLVARGPQLGAVRAICGPTDDRLPFVDACCVRVVDSVGGWGSGFMVSPNCMVTANHVMTDGPWTIQRNVRDSEAATGNIRGPANPAVDEFAVALAGPMILSPAAVEGDDWAVVWVPNNAGGAIPGEGCDPVIAAFNPHVAGIPLVVDGFGTDTQNVRNGTLQRHTGASVATPAADNFIGHTADTMVNNSGSRISLTAATIVAIHDRNGCTGGTPELGRNRGTLCDRSLAILRGDWRDADACEALGILCGVT